MIRNLIIVLLLAFIIVTGIFIYSHLNTITIGNYTTYSVTLKEGETVEYIKNIPNNIKNFFVGE